MATNPSDIKYTLMVCWALNEPENEEHLKELVAAIEAQEKIPGVLSIKHGPRARQVDWDGPDKDFDYAMVMQFDTIENGRAYVPHPIHQKLVGTIFYMGSNIRGFWINC